MKNLIYVCAVLAFVTACGPANKQSTEEENVETAKETQVYNYSGSFEMGDNANFDIIRQWNDGILAGDLEKLASLLADSVTINLWDGTIYNTTKDSIMTLVSGYLETITDLEIIHNAGMAVNSLKPMDSWGLSWITEQYTNSEGKSQRINFQESWLIENGKVRAIRQYAQMIPESAPPIVANEEGEFSYSGSWEKADDGLKEVVLGWNKALASPTDLDVAASFLADSVTVYMWDGSVVDGTRDEVMDVVKQFVAASSNIKVDFDAMMAVHSTDRNSDVVMSWTDERITDLDGNEEHIWIHEDYILENGKIRVVYQYGMKEAEAKE